MLQRRCQPGPASRGMQAPRRRAVASGWRAGPGSSTRRLPSSGTGPDVEGPVADLVTVPALDRLAIEGAAVAFAAGVVEGVHPRELVHPAEPAQQDRRRRERPDAVD